VACSAHPGFGREPGRSSGYRIPWRSRPVEVWAPRPLGNRGRAIGRGAVTSAPSNGGTAVRLRLDQVPGRRPGYRVHVRGYGGTGVGWGHASGQLLRRAPRCPAPAYGVQCSPPTDGCWQAGVRLTDGTRHRPVGRCPGRPEFRVGSLANARSSSHGNAPMARRRGLVRTALRCARTTVRDRPGQLSAIGVTRSDTVP
jgi:hypothetical protein